METITKYQAEEILEKLAKLQADMEVLKRNMVDPDCILTEDDLEAIEEAEKEYKEGRTICHEELKKELGLKCSK
jgi:hypothetical protein